MSPLLLEAVNLYKSYGEKEVINNLSFSVHSGEIVGLLGPNGSGKTTAFYLTMGLVCPDKGKVYFKEKDISFLSLDQRANLGMGYLAQEPSIFRSLTVEDNILCILETLPLKRSERKHQLNHLLQELHLEPLRKIKAGYLSGGERRRLEITRALVKNPSLLLLDEPFAGVDPLAVSEVKKLIHLLKLKGISLLITDHNAREIFSIADRSYLMRQGKILTSGTAQQIVTHTEAKKTYFGEEFIL